MRVRFWSPRATLGARDESSLVVSVAFDMWRTCAIVSALPALVSERRAAARLQRVSGARRGRLDAIDSLTLCVLLP